MSAERNLERALLEALGPAWEELVPAAVPPDGFADGVVAAMEEPMRTETADLEPTWVGVLPWAEADVGPVDGQAETRVEPWPRPADETTTAVTAPPMPDTRVLSPDEVIPLESTSVGPVRSSRRPRIWMLMAACLALLVGGMMLASLIAGPAQTPRSGPIAASPRPDVGRREGRQAFERVKRLVRQERWEEARALIAFVAELRPDDPLVQDYRRTIEREASAAAALGKARDAIARKDYQGALVNLAGVYEDSLAAEAAANLRAEARQGRVDALMETAREALDKGRYEQAISQTSQVIALVPDHPAAAALRVQAERAQTRSSPATRARARRPAPKVSARSKTLLAGRALAMYRVGDLATLRAKSTELKVSAEAQRALRRLESLMDQGMALAKKPGQVSKAILFLTKAHEHDLRLGGGSGSLRSDIRSMLGKLHFVRAVDAHVRKEYAQAYRDLRRAQEYMPDSKHVADRLRTLEVEAKKLYETAYVIKGSNPERAIELCRTVMGMVDAANVYYEKSRKLADRIGRPAGELPSEDGGF